MALGSSIFDLCRPRREVLAGELPDAIFAADLWDVVVGKAHQDYQQPTRFFAGTYPTENLKFLVREVAERLAGIEGGTPIFRLETGFGGGKTHALIAAVHMAREGNRLADLLSDFGIRQFPQPGAVSLAAFVGEESDPLNGLLLDIEGQTIRTFTPWGQIALMAGGLAGYEHIRENDEQGVAPARSTLHAALGDGPVLILLDELILYMARAFALQTQVEHPRSQVNSQWATFLQTLFSIATQRPQTAVILTLPSEQDANRKLTGELKKHIPMVLDTVDELEQTTARQPRNLTPTQSSERAAVLGRRLFESVKRTAAPEIAQRFVRYYAEQRDAGVQIDSRAYEASYAEQLVASYPFHPELVRLFAERLADIPEFNATRGALRLVARTIRAVWQHKNTLKGTLLLQPYHVDLTRSEMHDEILGRLGKTAFGRGLEADVVRPQGGTHANQVDGSRPWRAATEAALVTFLHSLPDGSRGVTPAEVALAVGRPGCDLSYVATGLKETEYHAWYMRREGEHYFFRTRASVNKRHQERLTDVEAEVRPTLDNWIQEVYSGFAAFQVIPFPEDHTSIRDRPESVRLVIIHYDRECGVVGGGARLSFTKALFAQAGENATPRRYKNNVVFLLAESTRIDGLKDAVRTLLAWERVAKDLDLEQRNVAQAEDADYRTLKDLARQGASGVPAEFVALESDLGDVREKLGVQELNVRTKLLEAYRVLAFPLGNAAPEDDGLFALQAIAPLLECYRVDFGEASPAAPGRARRNLRQAVAEAPILECLRENNKLVREPTLADPVVLAPGILRRPPIWLHGEKRVTTEEVWDRLRREPELPIVLKPADLLPTFRAGLVTASEALWYYYDQDEKRVYTRDNAQELSPVLSAHRLLYDPVAAHADRIIPVTALTPQEIWEYVWPRQGADHVDSVPTIHFLEAIRSGTNIPVMPDRSVLWQALQEGTRENRWILYLRGPNLAIGAKEIQEWPGTPRFDEHAEIWTYQAALDQRLYPRTSGPESDTVLPLTPANLKVRCWLQGQTELATEDLERYARDIWRGLSRPRLEDVIREGLGDGSWAVWKQGGDEIFYTHEDKPSRAMRIAADWILVDPASPLTTTLDPLRPGRGPQPVEEDGTPREVLTKIWETLNRFKGVHVSELVLTARDRETLDNTIVATWVDRPQAAQVHVSIQASGQRDVHGQQESLTLSFKGRFEELRSILSPIWPFERDGELDVTIAVRLMFASAVSLADDELNTYRKAMMNANQGILGIRVVPVRSHHAGGA